MARVLVIAHDPFLTDGSKLADDAFDDPEDYDFSFVHLSDTQFISENAVVAPEAERHVWIGGYEGMTQWVADNKDERKIAFVGHTGDIMQAWDSRHTDSDLADREYEVASRAHRIMEDAGVVTATLAGDNDNKAGQDSGPSAKYNQFFGPARYDALAQTRAWLDADASFVPWKAGDALNNYVLFSAGGLEFVAVNLSYGVTAEETAWASSVLAQFPDRNAFVLAHSYSSPAGNPQGTGGGVSGDGNRILADVVSKHPNVFMVLSGHRGGVNATIRTDAAKPGHNVAEILADYQGYRFPAADLGLSGEYGDYPNSTSVQFGAAFLRLLQFDLDRGTLSVDSYSPYLDKWGVANLAGNYAPEAEQFEIPIQLSSRTTSFSTDGVVVFAPTNQMIGEATAPDGADGRVEWSGLAPESLYAWFAVSRDAGTEFALDQGVTQFDMFTTPAVAADVVAPVLTLPGETALVLGDDFDPMAGVSAVDDRDGDVTDRVAVIGEVETTRVGTYSVVYLVADSSGNQTLLVRRVVVRAPEEPSAEPSPTPTVPTPTVPTSAPTTPVPVDVYTSPGYHEANGRLWFTECGQYSQTVRCRTSIWATQVSVVDNQFVSSTDWYFNNLTYLPYLSREAWASNPLGRAGQWTSPEGRLWRTECDTAATGRGGCRSYIWTDLVSSSRNADGTWSHSRTQDWVFNNIVRFKQG